MIVRGHQRGIALVAVLVFLLVIAAVAALKGGEEIGEVNLAAADAERRQVEYVAQAGMQRAIWMAERGACTGDFTIPATALGPDNYSAMTTGGGSNAVVTLLADQDAWIQSDNPTNTGSGDQHVTSDGGDFERALYRFDLSALPLGTPIKSATAWFYLEAGSEHPEGPLTVHRITADWTEADATWDALNDRFEAASLAMIPAQAVGGWVRVNLTAQVQAWMNGQPNHGIMLTSSVEGIQAEYKSREDASTPPRLEVVVGTGAASPLNIQAIGTLANGNAQTLRRPAARALQTSSELVLQPGPAESDDAEIWDQAPNNNYGDAAETWVSSAASDTTRSLLRFNMGTIPAGARILEAALSLRRWSGSGADQPVSAHRIMNPWSEATVTWNDRETGTNWDTVGGDFDNVAVATTPVGPVNQRYEWNIAPLVQGWVDGSYPNYGVALVAAIAGMPGERFYTSDHATLDRRPSLSVTYACECGTACLAPQGTGAIILVVAIGPGNLLPHEQALKTTFESWGYTVTPTPDNVGAGGFAALAATHDLVYVAETAFSGNIGTALTNLPIGVVIEEGLMNGALGIATSMANPVGASIGIVDNSHYITLPFAAGALEIYSADMEGLAVSGTEAPGLHTLVNWGGAGGLVVLETGAQMTTGGNAAGRRVMLPLGRNTTSDFTWDYLNANGRLLVQRAMQWASGNLGAFSNNLLFVVGNDGGLTAEETSHRTLVEGWGYTVEIIDDDATQGDFDTAVANNDVVLITNDITASRLDTKLVNATIGIVTSEVNLSDEFGIAAGVAWDGGTAIEINDNSHYITSPFATGSLTILSSGESLAYVTGAESPDMSKLASSTSGFGVLTLEAGATTHVGGTAMGRRVQLPWGGNGFDPANFTADGETILQRALEWGTGAGSPQTVLFVVPDATSLGLQDAAKKLLIESWGYIVTPISAADPQTAFDAAVAASDVAYVSEEITSTDLGTKLRDATIGVVIEETALVDEFGIASTRETYVGSDVQVIENTHYITQPFGLATLTIASAATDLNRLTGSLAPGLDTLADDSGQPALAAIDTGGQLFDSGIAAGRRVQLPWGASNFDINLLNTDGRTMMRRAIEWGAAGGGGAGGPYAVLMVVSDPSSLTPAADDRKTLMESWGHTVTLIDDNDSQANFDAGIAATDLVYVGSGSVGATIGNKLDATTKGVVNEPVSMASTLGFASSWTVAVNVDQLTIVDGTHSITQGFASPVTVFTGLESPAVLSGTLAPDLQNLAEAGAIPALAVLESGAATHDAGTTSGPRAQLPFASAGAGELTADGQLIVRRAIEWAAGPGGGGGGGGGLYVEAYDEWTASQADQWQTQSLSGFGVPSNAVVEVAVINTRTGAERWAGVREVGSSLQRRFLLHEAEGGGQDAVIMHVQANASSAIEHYADTTGDIKFAVMGYWTSGTYAERFDTFKAGANASWQPHDLGSYGVGPNQVAEIAISQTSTSAEWQGGTRRSGSSLARLISLHEAESGGIDAATMQVEANASSMVEVYAQADSVVDFHLLGYWSTPPGTFTEAAAPVFDPSSPSSTWTTANLSSDGVPPNSVVQMAVMNGDSSNEANLGLRKVGSSLQRLQDLQEAESGGRDSAVCHVNADSSSSIQWYDEDATATHEFRILGWWEPL